MGGEVPPIGCFPTRLANVVAEIHSRVRAVEVFHQGNESPRTRYRTVPETRAASLTVCMGLPTPTLQVDYLSRDSRARIGKDHTYSIVCLELWCATDELDELCSVEYELMEESYEPMIKWRGVDPGDEVLRVFANPDDPQLNESREDSSCAWRMSAFPGRVRSRGFESDAKMSERGQRGGASDHRLG